MRAAISPAVVSAARQASPYCGGLGPVRGLVAAARLAFRVSPHNFPWQIRANGGMVVLSWPPGAGESRPVPAAEGATGPRKRSGTRDRSGIRTSGKTADANPAAPTE